jgi:hypothetical protein
MLTYAIASYCAFRLGGREYAMPRKDNINETKCRKHVTARASRRTRKEIAARWLNLQDASRARMINLTALQLQKMPVFLRILIGANWADTTFTFPGTQDPMYLKTLCISSPYVSQAPMYLKPLCISSPYVSQAPTYIKPLCILSPYVS